MIMMMWMINCIPLHQLVANPISPSTFWPILLLILTWSSIIYSAKEEKDENLATNSRFLNQNFDKNKTLIMTTTTTETTTTITTIVKSLLHNESNPTPTRICSNDSNCTDWLGLLKPEFVEKFICIQGFCQKQYNSTTANTNTTGGDNQDEIKKSQYNHHMLFIMIILGVMFIGMCVALNLFSRARFKKHHGIFTNPRLLDVANAHRSSSSSRNHNYNHHHNYHRQHSRRSSGRKSSAVSFNRQDSRTPNQSPSPISQIDFDLNANNLDAKSFKSIINPV